MSAIEWNKKEDLLQDQALRHLKQYTTLFAAFATTTQSEIVLLNKIQEYCYENMNFLKSFNKIVLLLYKSKLHFVWKFGNFILMKNFSIDLNDTLSTDLINFYKIKNFFKMIIEGHLWTTLVHKGLMMISLILNKQCKTLQPM